MITKKRIDYKVPNGKLIRIEAEIENDKIRKIKINGDFFLHPEESISDIERVLIGKNLDSEGMKKTLTELTKKKRITLLGVSEKDFADAIMQIKPH